VISVHDHEDADAIVDRRQPGDIARQTDGSRPNALRFQQIAQVTDLSPTESEPPAFFDGDLLLLLDYIPF
jgi:hypothetical protein